MGDNNMFERFDSTSKDIMFKARGFIIRYFPYLILIANIVFEVLSRLFRIGFAQPFTPEFWSSLFINTVSSTLAYACFVFYAEKVKKDGWVAYKTNCSTWERLSACVRLERFDEFIEYCKSEYKRECEERRIAIIVNHTRISIDKWRNTYSNLRNDEIKELGRQGVIDKEDVKYVIKANKPPKVKPISPLLILAGMKVSDTNDAGRHDTSSTKSIALRPVSVLAMSIIGSLFAGHFIGFSDSSVFFDMLYTAGIICISALIGYSKGITNAENKNADVKCRIIFIERFEKQRSNTKTPE